MDRPLRYESTRLALQSVLANGSTGCLVSELEPHGPQVFVMLGQVMAAVSSADGPRGLALLSERGLIKGPRLATMRRRAVELDDLVAEVSGQEMAALRLELLKFNVQTFCRIDGPAWFEPMTQITVAGVLVGPLIDIETLIHETPEQTVGSPAHVEQKESFQPSSPPRVDAPSSPTEPVRPPVSSSTSFSQAEMSFFEDQDRDRMRGDGEFTVQQEHLEVVDLGPSPVSSVSTPGIRFANPDLNSDDLVGKITTCNEVLQHVRQGLTARGFSAVSLLQGLIQESDTELSQRLPGLGLDAMGQLAESSVVQILVKYPGSEHRRRIEFGLLDLMERALDLCSEHLDDEQMDEVLRHVAGFHQRIRQ